MKNEKTTLFTNGLIWFGAGVSISEILTGTYFAPLGFSKGIAAIITGHIIGCILLFLAGVIGGKTGKSSMETVKMSFGMNGAKLFSLLNIIQLIGWTAVMIANGAAAAQGAASFICTNLWCVVIGLLIILWLFIGMKNMNVINCIAMGLLFLLTVVMSFVIFKGNSSAAAEEAISFGAAVELAVAMPLSWLPLISDYTREAENNCKPSLVSSAVYFVISCWMYIIGLGAALFTGETDIAVIMVKAGLGIAALIIIIFSTVTTTFLDVYSAGISSVSIYEKINQKYAAIAVCVVGTLLAILTKTGYYEGFLYFIGSVFAPMIAVQIVDYYILKKDSSHKGIDAINLAVWAAGFVMYRCSMNFDFVLGNTLPVMAVTGVLCYIANKIKGVSATQKGSKNV